MAKKVTTVVKKTKAEEKPKKAAAPKKAVAKKEVKAKEPKKETPAKNTAAPKKVTAKTKVAKPAVKKVVDPEKQLVDTIVEGILDKKGHDIVVLDLRPIGNTVADWFIISHGKSNTQADAIADSVEETVRKKLGIKPWHTEGFQNAEWILLDYVNIIVHVFQEPIRDFYRLEDLWIDAKVEKIEESFGN